MSVTRRGLAASVIALVVCGAIHQAAGVTVTLTAIDAGFVTEMGGSAKGDSTIAPPAKYNYSAGREVHYATGNLSLALAPMDRKNYFVFDLTGIPPLITSATLFAFAGPAIPPPFPAGTHGYESLDPTETYGLAATSDVAGALADAGALKTAAGFGPAAFDDPGDAPIGIAAALYTKLAAGPVPLAAKVFSPADDGTVAALPFMPAGVMFLNAFAGGPVILGGKVVTATPPATPQLIFGFTGPDIDGGSMLTPTLEVTYIPEPSGAVLAAAAVGAIVARRRKR